MITNCPLSHKHRVVDESGPCIRCDREDTTAKDCPRRARDGSVICAGHLHGLRRDLVELPGYHEAMLRVGARQGRQAKIARTGHSEISLGDATTTARDNIRATLVSWVRLVAEETRVSRLPADTVTAMCCWLLHRLDWIGSAVWVDSMATELADLHIAARRLSCPVPRNVLRPGPCVQEGCTGTLVITFADERARDAVCDSCGATIPAGRVTALRRAYSRAALLSAEDVAAVTAAEGALVAVGTVRQWRSRGWLTPYPGPDGPRYDLKQVEAVRDAPVSERVGVV